MKIYENLSDALREAEYEMSSEHRSLDLDMAADFGLLDPLCCVSPPDPEVEKIVAEILDRTRMLHAERMARRGPV